MNNKKQILKKVKKLYKLFEEGSVPTLEEHEVNPNYPKNSRENYIYFTLPVCLNFQRSSPAMWKSALKTHDDPTTKYLFEPSHVVNTPLEKLKKDLRKHNLSLQENKHTDIWLKISTTLAKHYNSDPRELIKEGTHDVLKILKIITKDKRELFPYLRGPKLSNYWLFILNWFTDAKLKSLSELSIIPDTHIIKSSIHLGLVSNEAKPLEVNAAWKDLLENEALSPVDMHPVLWNWSRNGFQPTV